MTRPPSSAFARQNPAHGRIAKTMGEVRFDRDQIDGFRRAVEHFGSRDGAWRAAAAGGWVHPCRKS
jgi:hypothetical protein